MYRLKSLLRSCAAFSCQISTVVRAQEPLRFFFSLSLSFLVVFSCCIFISNRIIFAVRFIKRLSIAFVIFFPAFFLLLIPISQNSEQIVINNDDERQVLFIYFCSLLQKQSWISFFSLLFFCHPINVEMCSCSDLGNSFFFRIGKKQNSKIRTKNTSKSMSLFILLKMCIFSILVHSMWARANH